MAAANSSRDSRSCLNRGDVDRAEGALAVVQVHDHAVDRQQHDQQADQDLQAAAAGRARLCLGLRLGKLRLFDVRLAAEEGQFAGDFELECHVFPLISGTCLRDR
jgi:hypothetical protein